MRKKMERGEDLGQTERESEKEDNEYEERERE